MAEEADLQREIIATLKTRGYIIFRLNSGYSGRNNVKLCPVGTPDILAVGHRTSWIEVKGPNGTLRDTQVKMIGELRKRGQLVIIAKSLDDIKDL